MKRYSMKIVLASMGVLMLIGLGACTGGKTLRTKVAHDYKLFDGTFTVNSYSTALYNGLKTVAILDVEGDEYTIELFERDDDYIQATNIDAKRAFESSVKFVRSHPEAVNHRIRSILNENGLVLGYEVRPLFSPVTYGISDVVETSYQLMDDGRVLAYIDIADSVKKRMRSVGDN